MYLFAGPSIILLIAFWILIAIGRNYLESKTIKIFITIWLGALILIAGFRLHPGFFIAIEAILAVLLIIAIFGGDIELS
jgi:hypothetical protein